MALTLTLRAKRLCHGMGDVNGSLQEKHNKEASEEKSCLAGREGLNKNPEYGFRRAKNRNGYRAARGDAELDECVRAHRPGEALRKSSRERAADS